MSSTSSLSIEPSLSRYTLARQQVGSRLEFSRQACGDSPKPSNPEEFYTMQQRLYPMMRRHRSSQLFPDVRDAFSEARSQLFGPSHEESVSTAATSASASSLAQAWQSDDQCEIGSLRLSIEDKFFFDSKMTATGKETRHVGISFPSDKNPLLVDPNPNLTTTTSTVANSFLCLLSFPIKGKDGKGVPSLAVRISIECVDNVTEEKEGRTFEALLFHPTEPNQACTFINAKAVNEEEHPTLQVEMIKTYAFSELDSLKG